MGNDKEVLHFLFRYWRLDGITWKEIAKRLDISLTTLYRWRKEIGDTETPPSLEELVEMYPQQAWGQVKWLKKKNMTDAQRCDYMEFEMQNHHYDMQRLGRPLWKLKQCREAKLEDLLV